MSGNSTAVTVGRDTYSRLFRRKNNERESMDSIIKRLLDRDTPGFDATVENKQSQDNRFLLVKTRKTISGLSTDVSKLTNSIEQNKVNVSKLQSIVDELRKELESKGDFK